MDRKLKLPIGIDNFEKIRKENFYYVDKTKLIEQTSWTMGRSESIYKTTPFRKNIEYEYAESILWIKRW